MMSGTGAYCRAFQPALNTVVDQDSGSALDLLGSLDKRRRPAGSLVGEIDIHQRKLVAMWKALARSFSAAAGKPAAAAVATPAEINAAFMKRLEAARKAAFLGGGVDRIAKQVGIFGDA